MAVKRVCRAHLYIWCFDREAALRDRETALRDRIAPEGNRRLQTAIAKRLCEIGQTLGEKYDKLRRGDVKIAASDAIIKVLYLATRLLFDELWQALK